MCIRDRLVGGPRSRVRYSSSLTGEPLEAPSDVWRLCRGVGGTLTGRLSLCSEQSRPLSQLVVSTVSLYTDIVAVVPSPLCSIAVSVIANRQLSIVKLQNMDRLERRSVERIPPTPTLTLDLDLPKCNHLVPCGQGFD